MLHNFYNSSLKRFAKENRQKETPAENLLWKYLRNRKFYGIKFYRQRPIDNYIADFFAPELNLIIEIDGASHNEAKYEYDQRREKDLKNLGYNVLRFSEFETYHHINNVLVTLEYFISNVLNPYLFLKEGNI